MFALKQNKVVPCAKWMMDCGWIRCRFKNGRGSWCPASLTHRRPVPCSCRGVQTVWTRVRAYLPPHRLPRKIDLDGRLVTHEPWWSLSSLLSVCPPHPLLAVRRGSSDPHEEPPGVRRGAGRRHPHGLQRFQLPALRPLLVRDQRREWARHRTCWLPARCFTPNIFFLSCALRGRRQRPAFPSAWMLDMLNSRVLFFSTQAPYIAVPVSRARPVCRCLLLF